MNTFVVRFYGRVVVAVPKASDRLFFLMPNMQFAGSGLREHRPLMTIARRRIVLGSANTDFEPTFKTMTDGDPLLSEYFTWDLAGWNVTIESVGSVSLSQADPHSELVDLAELERIQQRVATLKPGSLHATSAGPVRAAIALQDGSAVAEALDTADLDAFVPLDGALSGNPQIKRALHLQSDIVNVNLPVQGDKIRLTFTNDQLPPKHVTVSVAQPGSNVISFSNLCNQVPPEQDPPFDFEFVQYYQLLQLVADDRLVPQPAFNGGSQGCNRMAMLPIDG